MCMYVNMRRPPRFTSFPYTTLFRSVDPNYAAVLVPHHRAGHPGPAARRLERDADGGLEARLRGSGDRKSTRLNSSHPSISYAVFCLKKKNITLRTEEPIYPPSSDSR